MPLPSLFHAGRFVQSSTRIECCIISGPCFSTARPLSKKCLHLRFTSSSRGSLPARGVPCIQADLSWSSIAGVSVAHRLAVLVRALCSVLWALLHWHTFTPARTLVPVPSFTVAFSKTTCLQLAQSPVFAACLVEMLINMLCRSFFPTLFANILIELPLARILPI